MTTAIYGIVLMEPSTWSSGPLRLTHFCSVTVPAGVWAVQVGVAGVHKLKACQSCLSRSHSLNCTCGYSMSVVCTYTVPCISCVSNETLKSTLRHSFEGSVELCCQEIIMAWQLLYMYTVHDIHEIHGPVYVHTTDIL